MFKKNDSIKFDDAENASIFKHFFSKLADDLVANLPSPSGRFGISSVKSYYKKILGSPSLNFELAPTTEANILMILQSLQTDKAAGIDNISSRFLKDGSKILAEPICQLCNLSISLSLFPTDCKIAKIKPLFKKGSKTDPKNYRPVSLLPIISKIIERVVNEQTQCFLQHSKAICDYRDQDS